MVKYPLQHVWINKRVKNWTWAVLVLWTMSFLGGVSAQETATQPESTDIPTLVGSVIQSDYVLETGDVVQVSDTNMGTLSESAVILNDGSISLPLIRRFQMGGKTVGQVIHELNEAYKTYFKNPAISVNVIHQRPVRVYVTGAVANPGVYVSGNAIGDAKNVLLRLGTADMQVRHVRLYLADALMLAGGVNLNANVRDVKIIRDNQVIHVDLWDLMKNGNTLQDFPLRDHDVIEISALAPEQLVRDEAWETVAKSNLSNNTFEVNVLGAVKNPGVYKVNAQDTAVKAITQAGGFADLADQDQVYVVRANSAGQVFRKRINLQDRKLMGKNAKVDWVKLLPNDVVFVDDSEGKKALRVGVTLFDRASNAASFAFFNRLIRWDN